MTAETRGCAAGRPTEMTPRTMPRPKDSVPVSRSDAARNGGSALTLELAIGTGEVEVTENAPGPSWTGIGSEDVWIVSSWNRSDGTGSTALPVEGMNHAAVSEEAARVCLKAADGDWDNDWDDWDDDARGYTGLRILSEELADLDPGERASYESCGWRCSSVATVSASIC